MTENQGRSYRWEHRRKRELIRLYGPEADYDKMFADQNGVCKLCGKPPKVGGKSLHVDHCHKTRRVRGLLCGPCNGAIGQLGDDLAGLRRAARYLVRPAKPAKTAPQKEIVPDLPPPSIPRMGWRDRVRAAYQVEGVKTGVEHTKWPKRKRFQ